jgi:hypothetical protein
MFGSHSPTVTRSSSLSDNVRNRQQPRTSPWGPLAAMSLLPTLIAVSGCAEPQVPVFPVSGKVTYQGKPPAGALIVLHAQNVDDTSGVAPSGVVKNDGSFAITVYEPDDGAPPGEYVATIQWRKMVNGPGGSGAGPNVFPTTYANPKTSPIKVTVGNGPVEVPPITIK